MGFDWTIFGCQKDTVVVLRAPAGLTGFDYEDMRATYEYFARTTTAHPL